MRNMSDIIEKYLKEMIEKSGNEVVEIKRAHIAEKFDCVPSQLNYVIKTRFTNEHGYVVESKRGGGGYIRITKVETHSDLQSLIGDSISQLDAGHLVQSMYENEVITYREAQIIDAVMEREVLSTELPYRDRLRAKILRRVITAILYAKE